VIVKNRSKPEDSARPGEELERARRRFPDLVKRSRLDLWGPGDVISREGKRLLIGIATYSLIELYTLDALNEWLESSQGVKIDVFDLDACISPAEVARYIPEITPKATPVLGIWSDGQFVSALQGGRRPSTWVSTSRRMQSWKG